jgi:hypothetical protein
VLLFRNETTDVKKRFPLLRETEKEENRRRGRRSEKSLERLEAQRNEMTLGFSKLPHEIDDLIWWNLSDNVAALFVNYLNHSDPGFTVIKKL